MNIKTRFRDLSFDQLIAQYPKSDPDMRDKWDQYRGKPIVIKTPHVDGTCGRLACDGPFYETVGPDIGLVCPCVVEIGD